MFISTDIPAGNGVLVDSDGQRLTLRPDCRGHRAWWFYWHIAIRAAAGRQLQLHFPERRCVGSRGPAISFDAGRHWSWAGPPVDDQTLAITVPDDCDDLRLAATMPYTQVELDAACAAVPGLSQDILCTSHGGRSVPLLRHGATAAQARALIVLTARHHCCESMASFVLDGALAAIACDPDLADLRRDCLVIAVPFMDCDGVADGDQGKHRAPHDHNRDYQAGRYAETTALRQLMTTPAMAALPTYSLDLHCPYIHAAHDQHIYLVGSEDAQRAAEQARFARVLAGQGAQALDFRADDLLLHGTGWNTMPDQPRLTCSSWFAGRAQCRLAATMEIPYGPQRDLTITPTSARGFGTAVAKALSDLIRNR